MIPTKDPKIPEIIIKLDHNCRRDIMIKKIHSWNLQGE